MLSTHPLIFETHQHGKYLHPKFFAIRKKERTIIKNDVWDLNAIGMVIKTSWEGKFKPKRAQAKTFVKLNDHTNWEAKLSKARGTTCGRLRILVSSAKERKK